ncbi:MAG: YhbY family RNA-binding protein [Calditrichaeota bacterium]|nr:YhbY family RNA-binding protein [Calditrichota bacterium]HQU71824.1 YhbY family RNA-binding protein [Calditrichia bacterium]
MLTSKERSVLRSQGNRLKAELWIGKEGISEGSITSLTNSFNTKELVKVKLQESCVEGVRDVAEKLAEAVGGDVVQVIGNTILLYREHPEED